MTAVLLGINENRLAHFKAERASILLFPPPWVAHTYLQGPWRSFQHPHCGLHTVAAITRLALMGCSWWAAQPAQPWVTATGSLLQNSGTSEGMAKKKIKIINLYWKGAGKGNVDAAARGHEAQGGWVFPVTVQPICQSICHFTLLLCDCNPKLINKLGIMNINKRNRKPVAKRDLVQPKRFSRRRKLA